MRQDITIRSLNDGLNLRDDPSSPTLSEGVTDICQGVDITEVGVVKTATGFIDHDLGNLVPSGVHIDCVQIVTMKGQRYILCSAEGNFYSNGTLIGSSPGLRFKAIVLGSNIFLLSDSKAMRFDGSTLYKWGIQAPASSPVFSAGASSDKVIEDFETLTSWIANAVGCTVTAESTIVKEATYSMKMAIASAGRAYSYRTFTAKNFNIFDDANQSLSGDIIRIWLFTDDLSAIDRIQIQFDVGDGTFSKDLYSFGTDFQREVPEVDIAPGAGSGDEVVRMISDATGLALPGYWPQTSDVKYPETQAVKQVINGDHGDGWPEGLVDRSYSDGVVITQSEVPTVKFATGVWMAIDISKMNFFKFGTSGDWSYVVGMKVIVDAISAVNVYFDDARVVGGGRLTGEYYFMFGYGRADNQGNVIHYGPPVRISDSLDIQGPINFTRQKLNYGVRPISNDPQVNCHIIYITGGTLSGWWVGHVINDNTGTAGSVTISEDLLYKTMISLRNEPAPGGRDMIWWNNRIWVAGPSNDRSQLRCSEISPEGDVIVEGFPNRNIAVLSESGGELLSLHEINGRLVVRGDDGEFSILLNDPTDLTTINKKTSWGKPCKGKDGFLAIGNSIMYPSIDAFVESNGVSAQAVMPEASVIIPNSFMDDAKGTYRVFDGFFYFLNTTFGHTIARIDILSGRQRLALHGLYQVDSFIKDPLTAVLYAVINGSLMKFDSGYSANGAELSMKIRSKAFGFGKTVTWNYLEFSHNTGGNYFRVRIFIDGVDRGFRSFRSVSREDERFTFGPISGEYIQVQFEGDYDVLGKIFLPIRIFADA